MAQPITTIPGAKPISEWASPINGFIATCVQAAEAVITGVYHVLPTTPNTTSRLAWDQIQRGEAAASGASNYNAAGAQLSRLGIPNTVRDPSWVASHNPFSAINAALARGTPVLIGVNNATNLTDAVTGARPDVGVYGHGLTIVGADQSGYLVADPNTPGTAFAHYSPSNLRGSGLDSLVIPNDAPGAVVAPAAAAAPAASDVSVGGLSLKAPGVNFSIPGVNVGQAGQAFGSGLLQGVLAPVEDLGIRLVLVVIAVVILIVGLVAFLFAGSGRQATGEAAKGAVKAVVK